MEINNVLKSWYSEEIDRAVITKLIIPANALIEIYKNQPTGYSVGTGEIYEYITTKRPWWFLFLITTRHKKSRPIMEEVLRTSYVVTIDGESHTYYERENANLKTNS